MTEAISIVIPGEPFAQPRQRHGLAVRRDGSMVTNPTTGRPLVRNYQPATATNWKATAAWHMRTALGSGTKPIAGAVAVEVIANFTCPRSDWRKQTPRAQRWHTKKSRFDCDNVAKAIMDAGTGILWIDDAQVASLAVIKVIASQGEAPRTLLRVHPLPGTPTGEERWQLVP